MFLVPKTEYVQYMSINNVNNSMAINMTRFRIRRYQLLTVEGWSNIMNGPYDK